MNTIPFQTEIDSLALTLGTSFSPELLLGISVFDDHGSIGAGVYFDLPSVSASISEVTEVTYDCEPAANSSRERFGSLVNIVPSMAFDVGLIAEAELHDFYYTVDDRQLYQALQTSLPLPTQCLSFDAHAKTFGPATNTATATGLGTSTANGGKPTSGAATFSNPCARMVSQFERWMVIALSLVTLISAFSVVW